MKTDRTTMRWSFALLAAALVFAGVPAWAQQQRVKPGIKDTWKSPDVAPLIERLEVESREIYHYRKELAALVAPRPGSAVADVGAGSGFMVEEFARLVGDKGRVFAVDINPQMMEHVARRAKAQGLGNVATVVNREDSVDLPPSSADLIFICDTYHHFEYPKKMLQTIHRALRPGGQLVIVEFKRVPGESADWVMEHVRGSQEEFVREITEAGFEFVTVHDAPFLHENYVARFRKAARPH